ncbi:MAG: hypothetical protein ABI858_03425 [Pseudoxanthomonas sp.]
MSFLNQLKSQARSLQGHKGDRHVEHERAHAGTEAGCRALLQYLEDLARQLNIIEPAAPILSLDGKTPWPPMKLTTFRVDARKKMISGREMFDYVAMGWSIVPQSGTSVNGTVTVNFPPDLERVESRLAMGLVRHERRELRHPEKNTLQALAFDYAAETRGNVTAVADHDQGLLAFRLLNVSGFGIANTSWPAIDARLDLLDELAKLIVSEQSRFV